ncbi:MAG TPA: hypothetical protein VJ841_05615 [Candidatus Saccharimonadales bacterium]|nr:hypothetical protein [Candidatus Saccharimonadales bacterium]
MVRVYVTTKPPGTKIRAIANASDIPTFANAGDLSVSYDGKEFYTVYFNLRAAGGGNFLGSIEQPAKNLAAMIRFGGGIFTHLGSVYRLDERATVETLVRKPVMRIVEVVETHAGILVMAQNRLDGRSHDYLDGGKLEIVNGARVRGNHVTVSASYKGHYFQVQSLSPMRRDQDIVTFDGQPAKYLKESDYRFVFADDLSRVEVKRRR